MLIRLMKAATLTVSVYLLLGLNTLQTNTVGHSANRTNNSLNSAATRSNVEPSEVLVALKDALIRP